MMIGSYKHQLDAKNRFRIPSKYKMQLGDNIVITKGTDKCLFMFSPSEMEESIFVKAKQLSLFDETAQKSLRLLLSSAFEAETDNQGRTLLPTTLKAHANIEKNIVFVGVGNRLEIWAEEVWTKYNENLNFDIEMQKLSDCGV